MFLFLFFDLKELRLLAELGNQVVRGRARKRVCKMNIPLECPGRVFIHVPRLERLSVGLLLGGDA